MTTTGNMHPGKTIRQIVNGDLDGTLLGSRSSMSLFAGFLGRLIASSIGLGLLGLGNSFHAVAFRTIVGGHYIYLYV
jgi:hypothetical protein